MCHKHQHLNECNKPQGGYKVIRTYGTVVFIAGMFGVRGTLVIALSQMVNAQNINMCEAPWMMVSHAEVANIIC